MRLLLRSALRFYSRRPWQFVLAAAGIALGVAVYVGVGLANDSARRAFDSSSDALLGRATHELIPLTGEMPERIYRELVLERGLRHAAPVVEGWVRFKADPEQPVSLVGVDPLATLADAARAAGFGGGALMARAGGALVPAALAHALGVDVGETLALADAQGPRDALDVLGLVGTPDADAAARPIVVDISTAQEVLGKLGRLSRIDLVLNEAQVQALRANLPPNTTLVTPAGRDAAFEQLTRAFRVNLTALSLLALFVGVFLIYATMAFAIVQRRTTFGTLRAIGVGRFELAGSLLLEAAVLGSTATLLGLGLGHLLAQELVGLVLRTVSDLSFRSAVAGATPSASIYWEGAALGVLATLVGAAGPALDAAQTAPRAVMSRAALERRAAKRGRIAAWLALPTLGCAALLLGYGLGLYSAFAALFFVLAAGALVTPLATVGLMRLAEPAARGWLGLTGSLAVRGVSASLSRTGVAVAALTVAVATVVGIGTMTQSFRRSFGDWLEVTLRADLYLTQPRNAQGLDDALAARIDGLSGVGGTSRTRVVALPALQGDITVRAVQAGPTGLGLDVLAGDGAAASAALEAGLGIMISETLAFRRGFSVGQRLELPAAAGPVALPIVGVFRDFSTDGGVVLMGLSLYRELWVDEGLSGLGVYLRPGGDGASVRSAVERLLPPGTDIRVRPNAEIKRASLSIFDRTFRITEVLRALAGLVAFLGMLSALGAIQLERAREQAVLRAVGLPALELRRLALAQTTLLGGAAGLLAAPLGTALAALLVYVINKRSFGWSMELAVTATPILLGIGVAVAAAVLAGIGPALHSTRGVPALALRSE